MAKPDCWGIEVGAYALKAIRLVREKDQVKVVDYDILPFKEVLTTPDIDVDEAIQVQLDEFLSRHETSGASIMVSVPGHSAFARFAKLPPVEARKIPKIVRYEAMQQIPFPMDQVTWDYQVFRDPDMPDVEVGIFAITKEKIGAFLENYQAVGMDVDGVSLSPLAVFNAYSYDMELDSDSDGIVIMDIGATATDMIIVDQGRMWMRTLPIGGNTFTDAIVRSFKLSFPKAEKLKCEAGTSKYARQIFQAMRPVFADLVQEMQRSLGFYQTVNSDVELSKVIGIGSTFKLPGLMKFLKQQLQMEIVRPENFERIGIDGSQSDDFDENTLNMSTAYGLALQGLGMEKVHSNLVPASVLRLKVWRKKQPYFAIAAAVILLVTFSAWWRLFQDKNSYDLAHERNMKQVDKVLKKGEELKGQLAKVSREDPSHYIENLRRVLDYRDIWPKLLQDLSEATRSITPQQAIVEGKYELIEQIPRKERRQLVIESITVSYGTSKRQTDINKVFNEKSKIGPQYKVVISGYTPYEKGPTLIGEDLLTWLSRREDQSDRPYRILTSDKRVTYTKVGGISSEASNVAQTETEEEEAPIITDENAFFVPLITDEPQGGAKQKNRRVVRRVVTTPDEEDLKDYQEEEVFPSRPIPNTAQDGDWRFSVVLFIQVLRPEAARQRQLTSSAS